jgi:hypothetical protein
MASPLKRITIFVLDRDDEDSEVPNEFLCDSAWSNPTLFESQPWWRRLFKKRSKEHRDFTLTILNSGVCEDSGSFTDLSQVISSLYKSNAQVLKPYRIMLN